jgi:hypothetical protein
VGTIFFSFKLMLTEVVLVTPGVVRLAGNSPPLKICGLKGIAYVILRVLEVSGELLLGGPDEHVGHEEGVVGPGADDSDGEPVLWVPAGVRVDHVQLSIKN